MTTSALQLRRRAIRDQISEDEWRTRVDLAACYRLMNRYGMTDLIYNHITAKIPGAGEQFLINAYGLHYAEVTASNLYKIDSEGNIVLKPEIERGDWGLNPGGFTIHTAVHAARADIGCVLHSHTRAGVAVSAMKCGLLRLSQHALMFYGKLSYHDYGQPAIAEEGAAMVKSLGPANNFMMLRNHGVLVCGGTVRQTFLSAYFLEQACRIQVDTVSAGRPVTQIDAALAEKLEAIFVFSGDMEWEAMIRQLDREEPDYKD